MTAKPTYAYHKGHWDGLNGRVRKDAFNTAKFQDDYNTGHDRGLIDAEIFEATKGARK